MRKKKVRSKSKVTVMRCSRYGNCGRLHVTLNGEEEVDCIKYLGSQVAAERGREMDGCGTQNELEV